MGAQAAAWATGSAGGCIKLRSRTLKKLGDTMIERKPQQLFVPTFRVEECLAEIRECLEKGWTGIGFKTHEFEQAWKEYTGLPHAHFLGSTTAGLHLALQLLGDAHGWADGDEVITTPLTF